MFFFGFFFWFWFWGREYVCTAEGWISPEKSWRKVKSKKRKNGRPLHPDSLRYTPIYSGLVATFAAQRHEVESARPQQSPSGTMCVAARGSTLPSVPRLLTLLQTKKKNYQWYQRYRFSIFRWMLRTSLKYCRFFLVF